MKDIAKTNKLSSGVISSHLDRWNNLYVRLSLI
jgi:hypothetical protein